MGWNQKSLRFGGVCRQCGVEIAKGQTGWHDAELKAVRCTQCGPGAEAPVAETLETPSEGFVDPVGGSSALRDGRARRSASFKKGAVGEYLADRYFHENLPVGTPILNDRRIPGTTSNVDHIVVVPSGVWVIDSKLWQGRIECKPLKLTSLDFHLLVKGKDRTREVEKFYELVIPVAQIVGDKSVPIEAAFCFINGDWSFTDLIRQRKGKPDQHLDVWLASRVALSKMLVKSGPLTSERIAELATLLNEKLEPR
jgi:hypothetical protein